MKCRKWLISKALSTPPAKGKGDLSKANSQKVWENDSLESYYALFHLAICVLPKIPSRISAQA